MAVVLVTALVGLGIANYVFTSRIEQRYSDGTRDYTDGLSVEYPEYRFNLRSSNTEPVLRLNVETRGDSALLQQKTEELLHLIRA